MGEMEHNPRQQEIQRNKPGQFAHEAGEEFGDFDTRLPDYKELPESRRLGNVRSKAEVHSRVNRISGRSENVQTVSPTKVQTSESPDKMPAADEPVPPLTASTRRTSLSELEAPQPPGSPEPEIMDEYEKYMAELLITQPSTQKFKRRHRDFGAKNEPFRVTQNRWSERHQKGWELVRRGEKHGGTLHKTNKP